MRVIIAGSRTITSYDTVKEAVANSGFTITTVISGCARGVDQLGEKWANENGVKIARFPANWEKYGKRAGAIRNAAMADNADALIAVWDGKSAGTRDMIKQATGVFNLSQVYVLQVQKT